jgi:Tol biopolymer transport system component
MDRLGGNAQDWGVIVGDIRGQDYVVLHKFNNARGAKSWRRSHPHPVFSPDGQRIYFNVSAGDWTQLYVAEAR